MELEWKEPPSVKTGPRSQVESTVAALQKNAGKWARVRKGMKTASGTTLWKKLGCESVARASEAEGRWDVFARWPLPDVEQAVPAPAAEPDPEPSPVVVKTAKERMAAAKPAPASAAKPAPASKMPDAATAARWPGTTNLDPDNPQDQYLARQRAKLEADRAARLTRLERANAVSR